MLMPKSVKFRKQQRGVRNKGMAQRGNTVAFGDYGLLALEPAWITSRQIEAARRAIVRYVRRGGIEQRAVQLAAGIVHAELVAQRIQVVLLAGAHLARHAQRVDDLAAGLGDALAIEQAELVVEEADIEGGVMDHQVGAADELDEFAGDLGELRLVGEEIVGQAVYPFRIRDRAPRIQVGVEELSGELAAEKFDAADFDNPITGAEIESGGFGIQNYLAQLSLLCGRGRRRAAPMRRRARSPRDRHDP